ANSSLCRGLRRGLAEYGIQRRSKLLCVRWRKTQRRPQLDHVVMRPVRTREDPLFAQAIHHVRSLSRGGGVRVAIRHQIDSQKKSQSAHIADEWMLCLEVP